MQDLTTGSLTRHLLKTTSFMLVTMFQTLRQQSVPASYHRQLGATGEENTRRCESNAQECDDRHRRPRRLPNRTD
jgi:hypothetical protein